MLYDAQQRKCTYIDSFDEVKPVLNHPDIWFEFGFSVNNLPKDISMNAEVDYELNIYTAETIMELMKQNYLLFTRPALTI